jgi:ribosomal protein L5
MNLFKKYKQVILTKDLLNKTNKKNLSAFPKLSHLSVNFSSKTALVDERSLLTNLTSLEILTGQCLNPTRAKGAISNFQLRKDQILGCKGDLRREVLYNFFQNWSLIGLARDRLFASLGDLNSGFLDTLQFIELERSYDFFFRSKSVNLNLVLCYEEPIPEVQKNKLDTCLVLSGLQLPMRNQSFSH